MNALLEALPVASQHPNKDRQANQEIYNQARKMYLAGQCTHDEFYMWLAKFINLPVDYAIPSGHNINTIRERLKEDKHLNNIQLPQWDRLHDIIRVVAGNTILYWSLSDSVCLAKAVCKHEATKGE